MNYSEARQEIQKMIAQTEAMLKRGREMQARLDSFYQQHGIQPGEGRQRLLAGCSRPEHKALTVRLLQEWARLPEKARELMERQNVKQVRPTTVSMLRSRYRI
jgi:hypothetical protein